MLDSTPALDPAWTAAGPSAGSGRTWFPATRADHDLPIERVARPGQPANELGFADLLDLVNPLQHIPIVSTIYRALSGDEIAAPVRVAGGVLFGGPIGFIAALANVLVKEAEGRDLGEMALASLIGDEPGAADPATDAPAVAMLPEGDAPDPRTDPGSEPLTGPAALAALAADLRGAKAEFAVAGPDAVPDAVKGDTRGDASSPAVVPVAARSDEAFAKHMQQGLDKYRALMIERQDTAVEPRVDTSL